MSEEDVSKQLAQMNEEIYFKNLLLDLDNNFDRLKRVFENTVSVYFREMDNRTYEIVFDSEAVLTHDEITDAIKIFFDSLREYLLKFLENKDKLKTYIDNKQLDEYIKSIPTLSEPLITGLDKIYKTSAETLINTLTNKMDEFSKGRINRLINEIIYKYFMQKIESTMNEMNQILITLYNANGDRLDTMNQQTAKM